jgi:ABC-2 type transport system permease protein
LPAASGKTQKHEISMKVKKKDIKKANITGFMLILVAIIVINIISSFVFTRFDLTSEKRYTLSEATKQLLNNLDDYVHFRMYLDGDFPAGFKRLQRETKEMLDEFRAYNRYITYEFINPSLSDDRHEREETYQLLTDRGLEPTDLQVRTKDGMQQLIIFPGAIVFYRDRELPVDLLEAQLNMPPEAVLNISIQNLEFKMADVIHKLSLLQKPGIAFIEGHGEWNESDVFDITQSLGRNYRVERITIDGQISALTRRSEPDSQGNVSILKNFEAIIIANPIEAFTEEDKFIIDQYIMRGGKVIWLIDPVLTSMDSISTGESTVGIENKLNLDDQLFKYGVRLNKNLVLDLNSAAIALRTGQVGNQPQIDFFRWHYFPLLNPASNHPVVRNMNSIKGQFVSSLDTVMVDGVRKTPLLRTSDYSRISSVPVLVTLAMLNEKPDERLYNKKGLNVAYLLEGTFSSLYAQRMPPEIEESIEIGFLANSQPTAMIVVADGDIIRNQFHVPQGYPLPLGYDQYTRQTYGNKDFLLNAVSYLVDDIGLVAIRSRELKIRLLDTTKVNATRLKWQVINTALPVVVVLLFGLLFSYLRKRKYAR